jgi:hypothetical protein
VSVEAYEIAVKWAAVVEAADMRAPGQDPFCLLMLGGAIINHHVVKNRRMAKVRALIESGVGYSQHPPAPGLSIQVLQEMTPAERATLKQDIVTAYGLNRPTTRRP